MKKKIIKAKDKNDPNNSKPKNKSKNPPKKDSNTEFSKKARSSKYHCFKCEITFPDQKSLFKHLRTHESSQTNNTMKKTTSVHHTCFKCDIKYPDKQSLFEHLRTHENINFSKPNVQPKSKNTSSHTCFKCDITFTDQKQLFDHLRTHEPLKPNYPLKKSQNDSKYNCFKCEISFPDKKTLFDHLRKHEDINSKKNSNQYTCFKCDLSFPDEKTLFDHLRTHEATIPNRKKNTGTKNTCYKCDLTFPDQKSLFDHLRTHEKRALPVDSIKNMQLQPNKKSKKFSLTTDKITYPCTKCNLTFNEHNQLVNHLKTHPVPKHICKYCNMAFKDLIILNQHIKIHINRPYLCDSCGKTFAFKSNLIVHNLQHTDFKQNQNPNFFKKHVNLKVQKAIDKKNGMFRCITCNRLFLSKEVLKKHFISHSNPELSKKPKTPKISPKLKEMKLAVIKTKKDSTKHTTKKRKRDHEKDKFYTNNDIDQKKFKIKKVKKPIHKVIKDKTRRKMATIVKKSKEKKVVYTCKFCKAKFENNKEFTLHLVNHINSTYISSNPNNECPYCKQTFTFNQNIFDLHLKICEKRHMDNTMDNNTHNTNELQFTCGHCFQSFDMNEELEEHILVHSSSPLLHNYPESEDSTSLTNNNLDQ